MSKQILWGDEEQYKKKKQVAAGIACTMFVLLTVAQLWRSSEVTVLAHKYGDLQAKLQWTEGFNVTRQTRLLAQMKKAVNYGGVEKARSQKSTRFQKHHLLIENITNSLPDLSGKNKGVNVKYVESNAKVVGN